MTNRSTAALQAATAAVGDCADTMEAQAAALLRDLPAMPMNDGLRAETLARIAGIKDASGRVTFELALLRSQLAAGQADAAAAVQRLSGMDAAMMTAVASLADVTDRLETAAEQDVTHERAFVLVIEAMGILLQALQQAQAATREVAVVAA